MTRPVAGAPADRRLSGALTGTRLALRGLWFRRSTAIIVLGLAVVASAASVVAPLYSRAAEESIVRSTLQLADPFDLGVHLSRQQRDATDQPPREEVVEFATALLRRDLSHLAFGTPRVALTARLVYRPPTGPNHGSPVVGPLVERAGVCGALGESVRAGRCPTAADEVLVSRRSLAVLGARVGDRLTVALPELTADRDAAPTRRATLRVVGSYDPVPVRSPYWAGQPYFTAFFPVAVQAGLGTAPPIVDPAFAGRGTAAAHDVTGYTLDVPILPDLVRLSDAPTMVTQLRRLRDDLGGFGLASYTNLPAAIQQADNGRELVRVATPLAVTQLVLLSWWTLALVVGSATEERSPELGLAKLRGLSRAQTGRFGLAETGLLLLVATPVGTVLGYAAVRLAAARVFAPGTEVVLTRSVLATVTMALLGAAVTVALSARRVVRRPVGDLLRRVPGRRGGRAVTVLEAAVVVLAVAGLVQLVQDRGDRPSPVALLAPGMVALVGGIVAGRWLVGLARNRSSAALERGKAAQLVGWSGVARRAGTPRIAAVLAFATCLLLVGVQAWSVAERNRTERADAEVGAAVVLQVRAPGTRPLLAAVRAADPAGRYAMTAVRVTTTNQQDSVLLVDTRSADRVVRWGAPRDRPGRSLRSIVSPPLPPPLLVHPGPLTVTADASAISSPSPVTLAVRLDDDGTAVPLPLGRLAAGTRDYTATVPDRCSRGCRLAALSVTHPVDDIEPARVTLAVTAMTAVTSTSPGGSARRLDTGFPDPASWRPPAASIGGPVVVLRPGAALVVDLAVAGGFDAEVVRGDAPDPQPAYAGSGVTRDPGEPGAEPVAASAGLSGEDARYLLVRRGPFVPGVGRTALLGDLELALRGTTSAPGGRREVWLARDDPGAERRLTAALARRDVRVVGRGSAAALQRQYAADGAVLALRLLLVCGAVAVLVAVGALLVAAYVGRRQRAYEVAALRVVGLRRRTVRSMLLRENLATVLVALGCGAVAALVASIVVLPSLPQFDQPSTVTSARYAPDLAAGSASLLALAAALGTVGLVVTAVQLRAGRTDRLREGVR